MTFVLGDVLTHPVDPKSCSWIVMPGRPNQLNLAFWYTENQSGVGGVAVDCSHGSRLLICTSFRKRD